jgi:hypothetical protein
MWIISLKAQIKIHNSAIKQPPICNSKTLITLNHLNQTLNNIIAINNTPIIPPMECLPHFHNNSKINSIIFSSNNYKEIIQKRFNSHKLSIPAKNLTIQKIIFLCQIYPVILRPQLLNCKISLLFFFTFFQKLI